MIMLILGFIFMFIGWLLSLTIIGALLGIPLMILGSLFAFIGFIMLLTRRRTVITNVVQVTNAPQAPMLDATSRPRPPADYVERRPVPSNAMPRVIDAVAGDEKTCVSCNTNNTTDSRFCTNCGAALVAGTN